ncbi:EAL domain-containing protein [Palleronia abyssalis]|uniref:EAL domain-containing protein n=1 Tax=Palleronia abyssalis TaxID=1501240 RepID=A0A2R8BXV5_9RHOB|nr:EAL domain-containing protein [Palleronia abyssalis]SPJ24979.1 hypothetical protein PAA8504_02822 [Palleronia abyssalis]
MHGLWGAQFAGRAGIVAALALVGWSAPAFMTLAAPLAVLLALRWRRTPDRDAARAHLVDLLSNRTEAALALIEGPKAVPPARIHHQLDQTREPDETVIRIGARVAILKEQPGADAALARRACVWQASLTAPGGCARIGVVRVHPQLWPEDHITRAEAALLRAGGSQDESLVLDLDRPMPTVAGPKRKPKATFHRFARPIIRASDRGLHMVEPICGLPPNATAKDRQRLVLDQIDAGAAIVAGLGQPEVGVAIRLDPDLSRDPDLPRALSFALDTAELPASRLTLHVSGDTPMHAIEALERTGCRICVAAIDTKLIGPHDIWLPGELTLGIARDAGRHDLVSDIVARANIRGIEVLAVDLSDAADADILSGMGCDTLSGGAVASIMEERALVNLSTAPRRASHAG